MVDGCDWLWVLFGGIYNYYFRKKYGYLYRMEIFDMVAAHGNLKMERDRTIFTDREIDVSFEYMQHGDLAKTAEKFYVTRERIRQILKKMHRKYLRYKKEEAWTGEMY